MGYFANGFVFTTEPDFKEASGAVPDRSARGYKHKEHPVWLLDLWKARNKLQFRHAPFCDPAVAGFRADIGKVDSATSEFLATFERLKKAVGCRNAEPEISYVQLALAVAGATRCPAYFFAADDEELDMACRTVPGSFVSFGCRVGHLSVQYSPGRLAITPMNFLEDEDDESLQELIAKAKGVAGVSVLDPRDIDGGQILHENPVALWPKEAGNPSRILGLGTWDPLVNVDNDFTVVFQHVSQ